MFIHCRKIVTRIRKCQSRWWIPVSSRPWKYYENTMKIKNSLSRQISFPGCSNPCGHPCLEKSLFKENMRFSHIYKGIPFTNEPKPQFLVCSHFFIMNYLWKKVTSWELGRAMEDLKLSNQVKLGCKMTASDLTFIFLHSNTPSRSVRELAHKMKKILYLTLTI